jgi:hypothetical protein
MKTNKILMSAFALTVAFASLTSCGGDDPVAPLPQIGGYDNAGQVGKTDLVAYWSMDGNGNESISGAVPTKTVATTFDTGAKGKAAMFNSGYMSYPEIAALTSTSGNITVSAWVKISNTKTAPEAVSTISPIFSLSRPNAGMGNVNLFGNTHGLVSSDSIQMKAEFHILKADNTEFAGDCINMIKQEPWMDNTHTWAANKIGGKWAHVVYVYDGTTANNRLYVNGAKISNSAWESRNNGVALPLKYSLPTRASIGALANVVDGTNTDTWNAALKGGVDEVRVWKKVLSLADINSLYELEKAGR